MELKERTPVQDAISRIEKSGKKRVIDAQTMVSALKAAYQQGRADALKEIDAERITLKEVLDEFLPKIKEEN